MQAGDISLLTISLNIHIIVQSPKIYIDSNIQYLILFFSIIFSTFCVIIIHLFYITCIVGIVSKEIRSDKRANARNVSTSLFPYGGITYLINSFDYPNLLYFTIQQLMRIKDYL